MIVFLNFAPIEFMGGAEKWMLTTAKKLSSKEKTKLISVDESISNIYAGLVLKRKFDRREEVNHPYSKINLKSLIPGTKSWYAIKKTLSDARLIYCKYEIQEIFIITYFLGLSGLKKTIAGVHSPFIYNSPLSFTDRLHNFLYQSKLNKFISKKIKKIHVLNFRDEQYFKNKFKLKKIIHIPNGINFSKGLKSISSKEDILNILFVGELSKRKGADLLIDIAEKLPPYMVLTIVGDGPMRDEIKEIKNENVKYLGYLRKDKLDDIYKLNDVLLLPSRAESMPLSIIEALSNGLKIIDSKDISLRIKNSIEKSIEGFETYPYIKTLYKTRDDKKNKRIHREEIYSYSKKHFSLDKIYKNLESRLFA